MGIGGMFPIPPIGCWGIGIWGGGPIPPPNPPGTCPGPPIIGPPRSAIALNIEGFIMGWYLQREMARSQYLATVRLLRRQVELAQ
jgi:hypothetical protein